MWVERDRVRPLDAAHGLPPSLREHEEAAIRRIDMQPQPLVFGHVGGATQIVDGPRVGGSRAGHEHEGPPAVFAVLGDAPPQVVEANLKVVVRGDGRVLFAGEVRGVNKNGGVAKPQELDLDVTGVRDLEILVDFIDENDIGISDWLDLADARVIK